MTAARKVRTPSVHIALFGPHALAQLKSLLTTASPTAVAPVTERFTKVSSSGVLLPKSAKDWEGVYERATGLVWGRKLLPGEAAWSDSIAKASAALLCGSPARAPTVRERFCLSEFDRVLPALDTDYFDASEKDSWEWTSTPAPAPSGGAWVVNLGDGSSYRGYQRYRYHVRAVRAGQFSDVGSLGPCV